jgi:hypothetical protein
MTAPYITSLPRDSSRLVCHSGLNDGSARFCRRTATQVVICDDTKQWKSTVPVCDRHAHDCLARAQSASEANHSATPAQKALAARLIGQMLAERDR